MILFKRKDPFSQFKQDFLNSGSQIKMPIDIYSEAVTSSSYIDLINVIKDNFYEIIPKRILSKDFLYKYKDLLQENKIFIDENVLGGFLITTDRNRKTVLGDAYVIALDDSMVEANDRCFVGCYNDSLVVSNDYATVKSHDYSHVKANGNSVVYSMGDSTIDASQYAIINAFDKTNVTAFNNAIVISNEDINVKCRLYDNAIHRVITKNEIRYASNNLTFLKQH